MLERFLNWLDWRRGPVWALLLVAVAASCYFASRLEILDSPERWMPESTRASWETFDRHFDVGDTIGVGLHFRRPPVEDDVVRLRRLRQKIAEVKGIRQVYDASHVAENIEDVQLLELLDPDNNDRFSLYAGALWDEPQAGMSPADAAADRTLVTVCELEFYPDQETDDELNARRRLVVPAVRRILDDERASGDWQDVDFHVASGIVMMDELESRARQVAYTFLPLSLAVGMTSLLLAFRSLRTLVVAVGASGLAILLVLGWLGAGGGTLGVVTVAMPTLVAIIVVASTMHFASYSAEFGTTGEDRRRPSLVRWVAVPCLGAAITTAVGFRMLGFNDLAPVRDLGAQLFVGSLLAFLGIFLLTQWVPIRNAAPAGVLTHERLRRFGLAIARWPRAATAGMATLAVALVFFAWPRPADQPIGLYIDADPFSFFSDDQPIARALKHFSDRKFGVYQLDVVLVPHQHVGSTSRTAADRKVLRGNYEAAAEFSKAITDRDDLGVLRVVSTEAFRERQAEFVAELARMAREQGLGASIARAGRVMSQQKAFESTFQSWNRDKVDEGALRLTFLAHDQGANGFKPLLDYTRSQLPTERFDCSMCGSIAQVVQLGDALSGGMVRGLGLSLVIIIVLCGVLFRSVRLTLLALPPNLFPVLAVYGLMGLFKVPISSGSAMVATIALGIALNDTIHFMLHYSRLSRVEGLSTRDAVAETIDHLGRPIVLTSVVLMAGFLVFVLTDFEPLYHFGVLSSVSMTAALLGDLVMLPNLLLVFDNRPAREGAVVLAPGRRRAAPAFVAQET